MPRRPRPAITAGPGPQRRPARGGPDGGRAGGRGGSRRQCAARHRGAAGRRGFRPRARLLPYAAAGRGAAVGCPVRPVGAGPAVAGEQGRRTGASTRPPVSRSGAASSPRATSRRRTSCSLRGSTGTSPARPAEILRWAACKWGIDQDIVFAQAAVESWWRQTTLGDWADARLPARPRPGRGRQAGPVPAELRHPAEQVSVRAVELAGDRGLDRDERGHRLRDLAVLLRRLRDMAEQRCRRAARTPPATPGAASAAGSPAAGTPRRPSQYVGQGQAVPARADLDYSPTSSSLSPPPAGQFHVGEVQPEPGRVDDRFFPRFFHPMRGSSSWLAG